jgi:lipoprotein-anchoring transpeptidase ErfK/SrfK
VGVGAVGGDDLASEAAAADTDWAPTVRRGGRGGTPRRGGAVGREAAEAAEPRPDAERPRPPRRPEAPRRGSGGGGAPAEEERLAEERRAEEERLEAERAAAEAQQQLVDAQERLVELGYLVGAADGEKGQQTTAAVMAFQAVQGLGVDGVLGPQTIAALAGHPHRARRCGGRATRIEVDMDRQVLHLVEGDRRVTTMKASTGRGGTFESQDGQTLRAETPVGTFTIDRRIAGEHQSSYGIGGMWDPMYFHGPWAIHGSPNVPAGPASAGCVRISMADGRWLFDRVPNGTPVVLYGGTHVFTP